MASDGETLGEGEAGLWIGDVTALAGMLAGVSAILESVLRGK